MRTRILAPEEWGRLESTGIYAALPYVSPGNIRVVVVEDDSGEVIGCLAVLQVTHLEGLWVKPENRNGMVLRSLLRTALGIASERDESWVLGGPMEEDLDPMDDLIQRVGGSPLGAKFYVMPTRGKYGLSC